MWAAELEVVDQLTVGGNVSSPIGGIGQYQNRLAYSEDLTQAAWARTNVVSVNVDATAPDGAANAAATITGAATGASSLAQTVAGGITPSIAHTFSVWLKQGTSTNAQLELTGNGTGETPSVLVVTLTNSWERHSLSHTTASNTGSLTVTIKNLTASSSILAWGAQLEQDNPRGVYVKTTATPVTATGRGIVSNKDFLVVGSQTISGGQTVSGTQTVTGNQTISGNLRVDGNTILGDAASDSLTINAGTASLPNATALSLANATSALNVDANTFVIDALNNRVGIGTATPGVTLEVNGPVRTSAGNSIDSGGVFVGHQGGGGDVVLQAGNVGGRVFLSNAAGTARLVVLESGLVGINDTTPDATFDVQTINPTDLGLIIQGAAAQSADLVQIQSSTGGLLTQVTAAGLLRAADGSGGTPSIGFVNDPGLGLYRAAAGQLGIAGGADLILGGSQVSVRAPLLLTNPSNSNDYIVLRWDGVNALAQRNGLNPQLWRLYNTFADPANYERATIGWTTNALQIGTEAAGTGTVRPISLTGGSVGIGTATPGEKLTVAGNIRVANYNDWIGYDVNANLSFNGGGPNNAFKLQFPVGDPLTFVASNGDADTERMRIATSGNVGIGTPDPARKLDVAGEIRSVITADSSMAAVSAQNTFLASQPGIAMRTINANLVDVRITGSGTHPDLAIRFPADQEVMRIQAPWNGGNVGIGTALPTHKLDVAGSTRISGALASEAAYDALNDGLILYLPFSDGSGTTATDKSARGNHGTLTSSPSWADGKLGKALSFPGLDDHVRITSPAADLYKFAANQDFTVCAWIKTTDNTSWHQPVGNESANNRTGFSFVIGEAAAGIPYFTSRNTCCPAAAGTTPVNDNRWHYLVGVRRGDAAYLYVDGRLEGTQASGAGVSFAAAPAAQDLYIGQDPNNYFPYNGLVDELRMYNRALSADEVRALYERGLGTQAPYTNVVTGKVGIGTTSPAVPLEVSGELRASRLEVDAATSYIDTSSSNLIFKDPSVTTPLTLVDLAGGAGGGGSAPKNAPYLVTAADSVLTSEVVVNSLPTNLAIKGDGVASRTLTLGQQAANPDVVNLDVPPANVRIGNSQLNFTHLAGTLGDIQLSAGAVDLDSTEVAGILPIDKGGTNNAGPYPAGSLIFSDGARLAQDTPNLFWDDLNNRLGIGTSSPGYTLDIQGPGGAGVTTLGLRILDPTNGIDVVLRNRSAHLELMKSGLVLLKAGGENNPLFYKPTGVGGDAVRGTLDGGAGFGGSANAMFAVAANTSSQVPIALKGASGQTADLFQAQDPNSNILVNITSTGNLGLGTSSPKVKLDIVGDLWTSGLISTPYGGLGRYENLLERSEELDQAAWTKTGLSVSATTGTAPDGTSSAETLSDDPTAGGTVTQTEAVTLSADTAYTFSIWLKAGTTTTCKLKLEGSATGEVATETLPLTLTSTWQRFSVTDTITNNTAGGETITTTLNHTGGASTTLQAWGAQLEQAGSPGAYARTISNPIAANRGLVVSGKASLLGDVDLGDLAAHSIRLRGTIKGSSPTLMVDQETTADLADFRDSGTSVFKIADGGAITASGPLTIDSPTFHVDSATHRVGIGTTSPAYPLHVSKNVAGDYVARIHNLGVGATDSALYVSTAQGASTNYIIWAAEGAARRFSVAADGAVTMPGGTANPTLLVSGNIQLAVNTSGKLRLGAFNNATDNFGYLTSANQLDGAGLKFETTSGALTNAGAVRMTILNDGNVGIGTTVPNERLVVDNGSVAGTGLRVTGNQPAISLQHPPEEVWRLAVGPDNIYLGTDSGITNLKITDTGRLRFWPVYGDDGGIGAKIFTSNANGLPQLHFRDQMYETYFTSQKMVFRGSNSLTGTPKNFGNYSLEFEPGTTGTLSLLGNGTGNVGIGTPIPGQKLSVAGTIESTTGGFKFPDGTTQTTAAAGGNLWQASAANIVNTNAGNVGIGTPTPETKLDVNGSLRASSLTAGSLDLGTGTGNKLILRTSGPQQWGLGTDLGAAAGELNLYFSDGGAANEGYLSIGKKSATNGAYAELMRVAKSGNVGIGTASPLSHLHIQGDAAALRLSDTGGSGNRKTSRILKDADNLYIQMVNDDGINVNSQITIDVDGVTSFPNNVNVVGNIDLGNSGQWVGGDVNHNLSVNSGTVTIKYSDAMILSGGGNVGIGISTPTGGLLHIEKDYGRSVPTLLYLRNAYNRAFSGSGASITFPDGWLRGINHAMSSNSMEIGGGASAHLHVQSSPNPGSVGIGATDKLSRLTVIGAPDVTDVGGTTTANASTTITGTGTNFLNALGLGDRIALSSVPTTYATVTSIVDALTLTVDAPLGNGTAQTINVKRGLFRLDDAANATKLIVNDQGNLGLGTITPAAKLQVVGGDVLIGSPTIHDTTADEDLLVKGNLVVDGQIIQHQGTGANTFERLTVTGETLLATTSGGVGIGTGSPGPGAKLDVRGNVALLAGSDLRPTTDSPTALNIADAGGADFVTFDSTNRRVQIGTPTATFPAAKLQIDGGNLYTWNSEGNPMLAVGDNGEHYLALRYNSAGNYGEIYNIAGNTMSGNLLLNGTAGHTGQVGIGPASFMAPLGERLLELASTGDLALRLHRAGIVEYKVGIDDTTNSLFITNNNGGTGIGSNANGLVITSAGNVGIGVPSPTEKLEVNGSIKLTGQIKQGGMADVAEVFPVSPLMLAAQALPLSEGAPLPEVAMAERLPEPGDVVVIDRRRSGTAHLVLGTQPYDPAVAGIVSSNPGYILAEDTEEGVPVALAGRVPCKVDARYGAIRVGDLLTTSATPGYAMKASEPTPGTILGKALEDWEEGQGMILVLVTLQ